MSEPKQDTEAAGGRSDSTVVLGVDLASGPDKTVEPCTHHGARCVYESDDGEFERWLCPKCGERFGVEIPQ
jgi:hypothetical protein